jgi:diguanylate cyclase (GGDEF)-like protein
MPMVDGECACPAVDLWKSAVVSATGLIGIFSFDDFFFAIVFHLATLMDAGGAGVIVFDDETNLRYKLFHGIEEINQQSISAFRFRADEGTVGRAIATGAALYTPDYPNSPDAMPAFVEAGVKANLVLPLRDQSRVIGAMVISWLDQQPRELAPSALLIVGMFAALVSAALYREALEQKLETQSLYDALTGLPNRRLMMIRLQEAHDRARRSGSLVAVGVIDLDGFKQVNDRFGHSAGDAALVAVAGGIKKNLRSHEMVARFGGDEFVVVLEDAKGISEIEIAFIRIVEAVQASARELQPPQEIGASVGVAIYPLTSQDAGVLLQEADRAMYLSKRNGGRRVVFAPCEADDQRNDRRNDQRNERAGERFA